MSHTKKFLTQNFSNKKCSQGSLYHPERVDVFKSAKEHYTIPRLWQAFGYPGKPGTSCKSPFRDDEKPSFSVFDGGRKWKDHATGDGGDIIEFLKLALPGDYTEVREWLAERLRIDILNGQLAATSSHVRTDELPQKKINWPSELLEGHEATWHAFAKLRGYCFGSVSVMVQAGILRFTKINCKKCFVVTDNEHRAAEIRALDRTLFSGKSKAYPLAGVDKTWLIGANMLRVAGLDTSVFVCEGATDLLTAIDLYFKYRKRFRGSRSWLPVTLLGAGCKKLAPECAKLITGRKVRIVPDADEAGDKMAEHWADTFYSLGCQVDIVRMDLGQDLTDAALKLNLKLLFS
jgi:hypothetical protein